ncbi:hypothetical protein NHX12_008628 [Muraenolepis orangiensis]|uniref:Rho GTPase-activating protein 42 n=1 Tax=Muraenolepis orangiensis TaxID=630683 RepID=A0A9Q0I9I4_9TELE|nr:hypothetical protein NHX12_008628 [Muraenolepis orangiensis]
MVLIHFQIQNANDVLIVPLETFRKEQIGAAKEVKKKFDKETEKYYSMLERHLSLSSKKKDVFLQEADNQIAKERQCFHEASLEYVFKIQEVQEKKKFEFVEPARNNFVSTKQEVEKLMKRMRSVDPDYNPPGQWTMEGFLYVQEKRPLGSTWSRHYCTYEKGSKTFTMSSNGLVLSPAEMFKLKSCIRRKTDSIDKRFCFDLEVLERHGVVTLQALSGTNRRLWLEAMDGKEPIYNLPAMLSKKEETLLNEGGFNFVRKCIDQVERRGIHTVGLYRIGGVNSKVQRLMKTAFSAKIAADLDLDPETWDNKTITSGLKNYLRCLSEPLMTFKLHKDFILAVKCDDQNYRVCAVHSLVHKLPERNKEMLEILIQHLLKVSTESKVNLMTVSNLGVVFGPTLMRSREETVAAMMNIKFQNIVVEILIENFDQVFHQEPDPNLPLPQSCPESRRNRAICLSAGPRRPRSLYPPTLCMADPDSDTLSSSPCSTPMGSMESLSSHSSEQNNSSKTSWPPLLGECPPVVVPRRPSSLWGSNGARQSPESGSGQTEGESDDTLSVAIVDGGGAAESPKAPVKAPHSGSWVGTLQPAVSSALRSGPRSCSGSTQNLLWPRESPGAPGASGPPDLPAKQPLVLRTAATAVSNGYQRPRSV